MVTRLSDRATFWIASVAGLSGGTATVGFWRVLILANWWFAVSAGGCVTLIGSGGAFALARKKLSVGAAAVTFRGLVVGVALLNAILLVVAAVAASGG